MTPFDPFAALALPPEAFVKHCVPKTLLLENSAFTVGDRRRIREGIEELRWVATLKPATIGIAEYRDAEREYLEIVVLKLELRLAARASRLVELVHRAVPYPVLLIVWWDEKPEISLAHKRRSLGEAGKVVIDGEIVATQFCGDPADEKLVAFRDALALARQPRDTLYTLYRGWVDTVRAFQTAAITGDFHRSVTAEEAASREEVLRQLLGDTVDEGEEKYGLNWHGKRRARQLALTPSTGTLRPCPEESVDWDTTQNLMIEGDNLEVLKLLQKSYAGRVKLIYIDPPYNSGKDFVYPDDFHDNIQNYLELTGQVDSESRKLTSNTETSGRFHTDWLNMMYPRLKAAKNLLLHDGIIFVSIDDGKISALRLICDEVFGEENFLACFIWKSRQNKDNRSVNGASVDHEYMICYGNRIRGDERDKSQYSNPDNDPRGDWASANMVGIATADRRPNLHYDLLNPNTGILYACPHMGWRYDKRTMDSLIKEDRILWPPDSSGRPRRKMFLTELGSEYTGFSAVIGEKVFARDGTSDIALLFDERVFDFPKPVQLIRQVIEQGSNQEDIVLDFFAGSGTTGCATLIQNSVDGGKRRYFLIQFPEPLRAENTGTSPRRE